MKKFNLSFFIAEVLIATACIVHVAVQYYGIVHSVTSAPAWVALLWLLPYGIAAIILGVVWLIVRACLKRRKNGEKK